MASGDTLSPFHLRQHLTVFLEHLLIVAFVCMLRTKQHADVKLKLFTRYAA